MKNSFWIIIGILIIVFLGLLFWPVTKKRQLETKVNNSLSEPSPEFLMDSPLKITWGEIKTKDYDKAEALAVEPKKIEVNDKITIRNEIDPEISKNGAVFSFDDNRNGFEYSRNID